MVDGATQVPAEDAALLNAAADSLDDAASKNDPGAMQRALTLAKAALPKVAEWGAKVAAEQALGQLLHAFTTGHGGD